MNVMSLEESIKKLLDKLSEFEKMYSKVKSQAASLEELVKKFSDTRRELDRTYAEVAGRITDFEKLIKELFDRYRELDKIHAEVASQVAGLEGSVEKLFSMLGDLDKLYAEVRGSVAQLQAQLIKPPAVEVAPPKAEAAPPKVEVKPPVVAPPKPVVEVKKPQEEIHIGLNAAEVRRLLEFLKAINFSSVIVSPFYVMGMNDPKDAFVLYAISKRTADVSNLGNEYKIDDVLSAIPEEGTCIFTIGIDFDLSIDGRRIDYVKRYDELPPEYFDDRYYENILQENYAIVRFSIPDKVLKSKTAPRYLVKLTAKGGEPKRAELEILTEYGSLVEKVPARVVAYRSNLSEMSSTYKLGYFLEITSLIKSLTKYGYKELEVRFKDKGLCKVYVYAKLTHSLYLLPSS